MQILSFVLQIHQDGGLDDAVYFGDYVTIIENGKEVSMSAYAPKFTAKYGTSNSHTADAEPEYVTVSADGYIVAKKATAANNAVYVTAELEEADNAKIGTAVDAADNKDLTLKITIGAAG